MIGPYHHPGCLFNKYDGKESLHAVHEECDAMFLGLAVFESPAKVESRLTSRVDDYLVVSIGVQFTRGWGVFRPIQVRCRTTRTHGHAQHLPDR